MRIGLLGYKFENENLGCVALTYSTLYLLEEILEEKIEIINFTGIHENMREAQDRFPHIKFVERVFKYGTRLIFADKETNILMKSCDVIFDITYGDNFSDIYLPDLVNRTTHVKRHVEKMGIPLVLMPQTIGPFENINLKKKAIKAIRNASKVYVRDDLSLMFVKENLPQVEVYRTTDMAFALKYTTNKTITDKIKVGVNVSGLLWKGGFIKDNQFNLSVNYRQYVIQLLEALTNDDRYEVHFIPHVTELSENANDGDLVVKKFIEDNYPSVIIAPAYSSPVDVKNYISNMDVFTGARMHSTIAAFSSYVPTIPFSYSRKFEGLYGDLKYTRLVNGREVNTEEAVKKTLEYIENKDTLKVEVCASMNNVKEELSKYKNNLKQYLMSITK